MPSASTRIHLEITIGHSDGPIMPWAGTRMPWKHYSTIQRVHQVCGAFWPQRWRNSGELRKPASKRNSSSRIFHISQRSSGEARSRSTTTRIGSISLTAMSKPDYQSETGAAAMRSAPCPHLALLRYAAVANARPLSVRERTFGAFSGITA